MALHQKLALQEEFESPPSHCRNAKISDKIIQRIRGLFVSGELNPGDKLGSEKELMDAFGVSKATLREALRVLEAMGMVEMRKGLMGGVFVAHVDMKTTISSIQGFLKFESVSIYDITMLRYLLEPRILRIAISRLADDHIENLHRIVQESQSIAQTPLRKGIGFHRYLARMTQNPLLILITDFIDNLLEDMKEKVGLGPDFYQRMYDYHDSILACIKNRDVAGAEEIIVQDILATGNIISKAMGFAAFTPDVWETIGERPPEFDGRLRVSSIVPEMDGNRLFFKRVGSGELYMMVQKEDG